jgi:outer membrane protein OmpA-like peptidoglycan-associated protein
MKRALFSLLSLTLVGLVGCATAPKPKELIDLEAMRETREYRRAEEDQADLVTESNAAHKKAVSFWEDEEMDLSKHWAILATTKLRTALSLMGQVAAKQKVADNQKRLAEIQAQHKDVLAKIKEADEQLKLYGQLDSARKAAREKEEALKAKLTEAQQREEQQKKLAEAQKKVADAQVAMKMADTVEAEKYAQSDYAGARALMVRAEAALKAENATDASTTADMAKTKAQGAYAAARPKYLAAKKTAERQAQNQALQKDAASIGGVTVKVKTIGQTQQLIIPVLDLFRGYKAVPRPARIATLNDIGNLLKKYPDYPVLVHGYTSGRIRRTQKFAVSQARAQQVASHFVSMGVDIKRMAVSGQGDSNLVAKRWSTLNDRVEVILLFQ